VERQITRLQASNSINEPSLRRGRNPSRTQDAGDDEQGRSPNLRFSAMAAVEVAMDELNEEAAAAKRP